ncbi:DgyrCDS397 [Dimorphilus gyrociliatus]|uniref:DgyrCDS397 n=1 Tax=Dimorphilus gyrociliatus TaxID=2664684 RepID=A0A7I8V4K4_9ANNE|nr:DgyrCDS397 [Dimorphilus gyrociliatus]
MTSLVDSHLERSSGNDLECWLKNASEPIPVQIESEEIPLINLDESFDPLRHQRVELVKKDVTHTKQIHIKRKSPLQSSPILDGRTRKSSLTSPTLDNEAPWRQSPKYPGSPFSAGTFTSFKPRKPSWDDLDLTNHSRRIENNSPQFKIDKKNNYVQNVGDILRQRDFSTQTFGQLQKVNYSNVQTQTSEFSLIKEYKPPILQNHHQERKDKRKDIPIEGMGNGARNSDQSKKHLMKLMLSQIRDLKSQMHEIEPNVQKESRRKKQSRSSRSISEPEEHMDVYTKRRLELLNRSAGPPPIWNQPPPLPHATRYRAPNWIAGNPNPMHHPAPVQLPPPRPYPSMPPQRLHQQNGLRPSAFTPINNRMQEPSPMLYMSQGSPPLLFIASPPRNLDDDCSSCSSCSCSGR